jgi:hypothetical protein
VSEQQQVGTFWFSDVQGSTKARGRARGRRLPGAAARAADDEVALSARIVAADGRSEAAAELIAAADARHDELGLRVPPEWHESGDALSERPAPETGPEAAARGLRRAGAGSRSTR